MRPLRIIGLSAALLATTALAQDALPINDLGIKQSNEQESLTLTAKNLNCETPQDFEFTLDNLPWLVADGPLIVRGLGPGQTKSIKAQLDFRYTPPGIHYGRLSSRCITCGWYVFSSCNENAQDIVLKVTVVDPAQPVQQANFTDRNPYAGMAPRQPVQAQLVQPVGEADIRVLKDSDKKDLNQARRKLRAAETRGQNAQNALSAAQKKKSDCERKLAQLRAEAAAARQLADQTKQAAKTAKDAADTAKDALNDYQDDKDAALKKVDDTMRAVQVGVRYRNAVEKEDGTSTQRYRNAQDQVDRFQQEHFDALREHTAVSKSYDARKNAADNARQAAADAKTRAEQAKKAAEAAEKKVKDQIKICGGAMDELESAQDELDDARSNAAQAVRNANKAEIKAAGKAAERLEDRLKQKIKECKDMEAKAKEEMAKWTEAIRAGQKLKMLDEDGGAAANAMKAVNDKIWAAAQDLAQDHTIATVDNQGNLGVANDETADLASADTVEDVLDRVTTVLGWAVDEMSAMAGGKGVPDFGQSQILGGMKGLGLGMQNMVNAIRNPNTYAAQRNKMLAEIKKDENYMEKDMREKGIGKNKADRAEILKRIEQLHGNRNLNSRLTERNAYNAAKCVAERKDMERRLAALKQQAAQK